MTYKEMFKEVAAAYELDWRLLVEIAYLESELRATAVGRANEAGLMQIMPQT